MADPDAADAAGAADGPAGTFCLVLHSHLPWLAHHGRWPVGEEWLYQSWAHAYLPVLDVVRRLAAEGRRDLLTLGVTPVLAAQLDDPHCLRGVHEWLERGGARCRDAARDAVGGARAGRSCRGCARGRARRGRGRAAAAAGSNGDRRDGDRPPRRRMDMFNIPPPSRRTWPTR